jgi:predicted nuclease of predicted toxin-antitoxin system
VSVVPAKLLLDENISPKVAEKLAHEDGIDACHVRDRGLLAATDHEVLECAFNEDRVLVTSNVRDFLKLARARKVHPGIIMLEDGALPRDEQLRTVRVALATLSEVGDLTNKVVWVAADGSTRVEDIPPP